MLRSVAKKKAAGSAAARLWGLSYFLHGACEYLVAAVGGELIARVTVQLFARPSCTIALQFNPVPRGRPTVRVKGSTRPPAVLT